MAEVVPTPIKPGWKTSQGQMTAVFMIASLIFGSVQGSGILSKPSPDTVTALVASGQLKEAEAKTISTLVDAGVIKPADSAGVNDAITKGMSALGALVSAAWVLVRYTQHRNDVYTNA